MKEFEEWDDPNLKEYTDLEKYAFVSQRAIDHNFVGYCYRENSDIKIDSGWRFLYGDEDEEYLDNPDNIVTQDLADIIDWKPELKDVLPAKPGKEFEWDINKEIFEEL